MKTILISALFLFFFTSVFAQYPFEKYPAIKYKMSTFKVLQANEHSPRVASAQYHAYRIELSEDENNVGTNILLYFKKKVIKRSSIKFFVPLHNLEFLYIADIDGNKLPDFKFYFINESAGGLASSLIGNVYLFNMGANRFKQVFFADFYHLDNKEFDLNNDDNYEIVSGSYLSYKNRAYWVIDAYNFKNGNLVNVGGQLGYPMIYKFFETETTYKMTKKIQRKDMKKFSKRLPEFYEQDQ